MFSPNRWRWPLWTLEPGRHLTKTGFQTHIFWEAIIATQVFDLFVIVWTKIHQKIKKYPCGHVCIAFYGASKMGQNVILRGFEQWFLDPRK